MKPGSSDSWRKDGDNEAFDHESWELKSQQFYVAAKQLLVDFDTALQAPNFQSMLLLPTAEFLASLALELVSKAYYLKSNHGPKEDIYSHNVLSLCGEGFFNQEQTKLMFHAQRYVVWAGRYPTPKWTKETYKEGYDVPSKVTGNYEQIDGRDVPNWASRPRADDLLALYEYVRNAWQELQ